MQSAIREEIPRVDAALLGSSSYDGGYELTTSRLYRYWLDDWGNFLTLAMGRCHATDAL
jgi:hypothetical protein